MPKSRQKKRKHKHSIKPDSSFWNVEKELKRIGGLVEAEKPVEALHELELLAQKAPRQLEIFETAFAIAIELNDKRELLKAAVRLVELDPGRAYYHFNLFGVYQQNFLPALALQTGQLILDHPSDSSFFNEVNDRVQVLRDVLKQISVDWKLPEKGWLEILVLHDQVQVAMTLQRFAEARRLATDLISLAPRFVSSYNNRSLASWVEGDTQSAIADARQALEVEANNINALGNLIRFLRLTGQIHEARELAERLKTAPMQSPFEWTKKAEAFSYLADDATVLEFADQADKAGELTGEHADPMFLHLAGVAAARLGDERRARRLWHEALKHAPAFTRAQAQLDDLEKPLGERDGPWPFAFDDWLTIGLLQDIRRFFPSTFEPAKTQRVEAAVQQVFCSHPEMESLIPVLLERGDPMARQFACAMAQVIETPVIIEALRNFLLSPNGPDQTRYDVMNTLRQAGVLKGREIVPVWLKGEQRELTIYNYTVDDQPYEKLPPEAEELAKAGLLASQQNDLEVAERSFRDALSKAPDSASVQYNLATVEFQRGQIKKARLMMEAISQQHPQYVFAQTQLALMAIANDRPKEAKEILNRVADLEHFHHEEFAIFCKAQLLLAVYAKEGQQNIRHWLELWDRLGPGDDRLEDLRPLVEKPLFARSAVKEMLRLFRE